MAQEQGHLLRIWLLAYPRIQILPDRRFLESLNSVLIRQGLPLSKRLAMLNGIAITQMQTLLRINNIKRLK